MTYLCIMEKKIRLKQFCSKEQRLQKVDTYKMQKFSCVCHAGGNASYRHHTTPRLLTSPLGSCAC